MSTARGRRAVTSRWPHLGKVEFEGVRWADIDWDLPLHSLGDNCPECGSDQAEGHQNACRYLFKNQTSPAGAAFLREMLRGAVERERAAGLR